nr:PEPxxWA-CTERM sorting domain-containing protein [Thiobacillaceae bacterium]
TENFDGTSLNTVFIPGQTITGSDFYVVQGLAYDFAKGVSSDRYVNLQINSLYPGSATIKSTTLFNLVAGTQYKLSFDFSPTSGAPGNGPFNWNLTASIGGFTTTVNGSSGFGYPLDWQPVQLFFTPANDVNLVPIIFAMASDLTDYVNAPIDNVSFSAAPVPEPETWAMLLAGLGLVGFAARRGRG